MLYVRSMYVCLYVVSVVDRQVDADLQEDFLDKIGKEFGVDRREASDIFGLLLKCMDYRQSVSRGMCVFSLVT